MARTYHTHPKWPKSRRVYIATTTSERQALKRRGWVKRYADDMPGILTEATTATAGTRLFSTMLDCDRTMTGTWFISTPLTHERDDPAKYRMIYEGLTSPKDF